jgi:hypothetical protein
VSYSINPTVTPYDRPSDWVAINAAEYHIWSAAKALRVYPHIGADRRKQHEARLHLARARHLLELVRTRRIRCARRCAS